VDFRRRVDAALLVEMQCFLILADQVKVVSQSKAYFLVLRRKLEGLLVEFDRLPAVE